MLRDITIGQYYPVSSVVHRLDPRTKLVGTLCYIVSLFCVDKFMGFALVALLFAGVVLLSKVPFRYIVKGLRPILFLLCFTVVYNFFLTPGEVLAKWWIFKLTKEGLRTGIFMGIRLTLLILGSSLMTFTTTPNQLTDGLESLMRPLKLVRFPVHDIAMMMSIALRFIPILLEEADKIMKAQQARGADFESGNLITRVKAMVPIFVPLLISAFRRAYDLAQAMEARCYHGGKGRTKMKPLTLRARDFAAFGLMLGFVAGLVVFRKYL